MKRSYLFLFLILLTGAFLRFYKLGDIPKGLHRDEAFLGYNAYSILKTGRDMSGNFLPLHLKSFIYSPAGYSYFSIPLIAVFGLSSFSVRFASAFFGTLTIIVLFFLVQQLFRNSKLSTLSSLLLALSPWHITLSRTATENIVVTFFIVLGILLYLRKRTFLAFLSFSLTLTLYQAPRVFLPLFIPILIKKTNLKSYIFYLMFILLPIFLIITNPNLSLRIRTVSLFADQNTQLTLDEYIREDGVAGTKITRAYHNKLIGYADQFLKNYFSHFSYDFLFTDKGLPDRYRVPNQGLLYIFELPLLLLGFFYLLRKPNKETSLLLGWLALAPIGAALTFDDLPNLQRTVFMLPVLSVFSAVGLVQISKTKFKFLLIFIVYFFAFYLHQYFIHSPTHKPWFRHEGYEQLVSEVNTLLPNYQKAVITDRESAPAIFFLFFGKYDPQKYLDETVNRQIRDYDRENFGLYEFSQEECPLRLYTKTGSLTGQPGTLYVNYGTCNTPSGTKELHAIRRGDQSVVFRIIQMQ